MLELRDLSFAYPVGRPLLGGLSFTFRSGGICAVLGPNGTGKTTLLKLLLGILKPSSGEILLSGMPIGRMTAQRRARKLAYIPQDVSLRFPLSVFEFVLLGRKPWFVWGPSPSDVALTGTVLSRLDLDALAERSLANLSGGQRQKVALARALVQETDWLLLDEPTSSLDLRHQVEVLTTVRRVATKQGKGVILSMHDINLAARSMPRTIRRFPCGFPIRQRRGRFFRPVQGFFKKRTWNSEEARNLSGRVVGGSVFVPARRTCGGNRQRDHEAGRRHSDQNGTQPW